MVESINFDFKKMAMEGGQGLHFQDPINQALDAKELRDMATHSNKPSSEGASTDTLHPYLVKGTLEVPEWR